MDCPRVFPALILALHPIGLRGYPLRRNPAAPETAKPLKRIPSDSPADTSLGAL